MDGDNNLFTEIHKIKQGVQIVSTSIDGQHDDKQIAQHFSDKYKELFNLPQSNTNSHEYGKLLYGINDIISQEDSNIFSHVYVIALILRQHSLHYPGESSIDNE